jgi:hypothetical protein
MRADLAWVQAAQVWELAFVNSLAEVQVAGASVQASRSIQVALVLERVSANSLVEVQAALV